MHRFRPTFLSVRARRWAALAAGLALAAVSAGSALAAAPSNDSLRNSIVIGSIPYTNTQDTTQATSSATDPGYCLDPSFGRDLATVWYEYTATVSGPLGATAFGSDYDTTLYVGTLRGARLQVIACGDDSRTLQSTVRFDAVAGQTYFFMIGASPFGGANGGNLVFNLDVGPVAQVVDLHVNPVGTLKGLNVVFSGTVSCTAPTDLGSLVVAELVQTFDGTQAAGTGFADALGCPGVEIPFVVSVPNDIGRFQPGEATAQFIYAACNTFECANETINTTVLIVR